MAAKRKEAEKEFMNSMSSLVNAAKRIVPAPDTGASNDVEQIMGNLYPSTSRASGSSPMTTNHNTPATVYKWNLHGGKTTMLYLNLSGHDIFKTRFGTSPEKHCLTATPYRNNNE